MKEKRPTLHSVPPIREKSYAELLMERCDVESGTPRKVVIPKMPVKGVPATVDSKEVIKHANRALNILSDGIEVAAQTIVDIIKGNSVDIGGNRFKAAVFVLDRFNVTPKDLMKDVGDIPWSTAMVKGISRANLQKVSVGLESDAG